MKIQIRKGMFETNSSSVHSLIITNARNKDEDYKAMKKEEWIWYPEYINESDCVYTKEDKVLMLGGLFDSEKYPFNGGMDEEYKIFLKVLKDNNEIELLQKLKENRLEFKECPDEPYCTNYFCEGCLIDCNCGFYKKFHEYFQTGSICYDEIEKDIGTLGLPEEEERKLLRKIVRDNRKELYKKLYDFIYGDGLIIPYATM